MFSRNRVWEHKYSGSMLSRDPFELTGSLDDNKGKKMLLLHLMHNVIYDDSRRYLLNQVSALEEQRRQNLLEREGKRAARNVDNGSNSGGGDEPADEQQNDSSSNSGGGGEAAAEQPTYGSTSGGEAEQSNGDHLEGNVEEIIPQQPSTKKGPKKNFALQAIQTNLRFGHLAEAQNCDGKRTTRPVVKLGSAKDGGSSEGTQLGRVDSGGVQSKTTAGGNKLKKTEQKNKPIAVTTPRTSKKAVRITKTTTKPATSTTGRRKRGQENTQQDEEEEMEETQLKRPRGRPPTYNSIPAVPPEATSSSTATSSTHGNELLAMQQRAFEKQLAELKAENAKVAKAQAAAVADALAKFSKDADEKAYRARDRDEEQLGFFSYLTKFYFF